MSKTIAATKREPMSKVFVVEGTHWEVPGRVLAAYATLASARVEALSMVNVMLKELEQTPVGNSGLWEAGLARVIHVLGHKDIDPDDYPNVMITELPLQGVPSRPLEVG